MENRKHNGNREVSIQVSKQIMLHEAQMIDSQRRILSAINGVVRAIESKNKDQIINEKNNLNIQIVTGNGILNDRKFKGKSNQLLAKLKSEFREEINKLPESIRILLYEYIDDYMAGFHGEVPRNIPIITDGRKMNKEEQEACLFALSYAGHINDQQKMNLDNAETAEDLTIFKEKEVNPLEDDSYIKDYDMIKEHRNVFERHSRSFEKKKIPISKPYPEKINANKKNEVKSYKLLFFVLGTFAILTIGVILFNSFNTKNNY